MLLWLKSLWGLNFAWWPAAMMLTLMQLVERSGGQPPLDRQRQVDLGALLNSIPDAVFLFDNHGCLLDLNRLGEALCGRTRDQLRTITIAGLNQLLAARDEFDKPVPHPNMGVNRALRGETVRDVRRIFRNATDGRLSETLTSASPIREANGEIRGAILIVRDVTEVRQLQRRLEDARRHEEAGQMAAGLAHDFSNVLESITQAVSLVDSTPFETERHEYLQLIRSAVGRGAEIIDCVREYLRTGFGPTTEVDVRQLLRDVLELTRPLWRGSPHIVVSADLQSVPSVLGNAADLRRVFTNLIINALEAMPEGGKLTVRCEGDTNRVRALISDTGQGIGPEQQKQLFVPYFTTKSHGTGLGLSGARRIIDNLHGRINLWSEPGKGTTFIVELPASTPAQEQDNYEKSGPQAA
jgi:PAS domain S-box-containing protein